MEDYNEPANAGEGQSWNRHRHEHGRTVRLSTPQCLYFILIRVSSQSAAASAFIKCSSLPELASQDFPHDGVPLVIWSGTESAVTIMAASMPVLRVLFQDVRDKTRPVRQPKPATSSRRPMLSHTSGRRSFYNRPRKDLVTMTTTTWTSDIEP